MKVAVLFSLFLASVAVAFPKEDPTGSIAQYCACEEPICPFELRANCICKEAAYKACKDKQKGKYNCPKPTWLPTVKCEDIYKTTTTKPTPTPTPPPTCQCEPKFCAQVYPQSCYCENQNKLDCYTKCGGTKPVLQTCPPIVEPAPCQCDEVLCVQSYPESCYCHNDAQTACFKKCGTKPQYQVCPVKTTTKPPQPTQTWQPCGSRGLKPCATGYVCVNNPYTADGGCGIECDRPGICVKDKICGGFANFKCPTGQVCVDDPRDDCDVARGGRDCSGVCV